MEGIEDRLRTSLRQRAEDVEPTPALWRSVQARISRRRRGVVLSWSLAGAAAAVAALAVVPSALELLDDGSSGPSVAETPEISESPDGLSGELTPGAALPAGVVLADGEGLTVVELPSGERRELPGPQRELLDVAVRPGTTLGDGLEVAYAAVPDGGEDRVEVGVVDAEGRATTLEDLPRGEAADPSVVWNADGDWLAWTAGDGDGSAIHLSEIARPARDHQGAGEADHQVQPGILDRDGRLAAGLRLDDWFGYDHNGSTDGSLLFGTHPEHDAVSLPARLEGEDGAPQVLDALTGHGAEGLITRLEASPDREGGDAYDLIDAGDGLRLEWVAREVGEPIEGEPLALPDDLDAAPTTIDALGDAVALGDGERAWLVTHDGDGGDPRIAELGAARAVSVVRDGGDREQSDEQAEGDEASGEDSGEDEPQAVDDGIEWSTPLLTTDAELGSQLALLDAETGESRELVALDEEGEAYLQAVAVEPGSTPDDLTAAVLASVEGTYELRLLQIDEDGVDCCRPLREELQVDMDGPIDGEHSIPLPVWSPSGDVLAWVESSADTHWLRTVAWDGESPVDDPDAHQRIDLGALGVEREVALQDWVEQERADGETHAQVYFTGIEMERSAIIELPVTSRGGVVEATDDAFTMGTDVARPAVDHAPAVAGLEPDAPLEDPAAARVRLEWTPGSSSWLTFGRETDAVQLPDDHGEGLDLEQRPWLVAGDDGGAVTGVGGALYRVGPDGEVTRIEGAGEVGVTHADLVD